MMDPGRNNRHGLIGPHVMSGRQREAAARNRADSATIELNRCAI